MFNKCEAALYFQSGVDPGLLRQVRVSPGAATELCTQTSSYSE